MRILRPLVGISILFLGGCAVTGGWQPAREDETVQVSVREYPGSAIPEFRAETTIGTSMSNVVTILTDFGNWPEWVYGCRQAEILQTVGYTEAYIYQIVSLPLVRDRDMLMHAEMTRMNDGDTLVIEVKSAPEYCDDNQRSACRAPNESDLVRVKELSATFTLERLESGRVKLTWQQHFEPGGLIPAWATRLVLANVPMRSLRGLRKQVRADALPD